MGFSISYSEVTRYKQSVVLSTDVEDIQPEGFPGCFSQWVADNIDHNVATLDGHGSFHGMGIIAVATPTTDANRRSYENVVPRCSSVASRNAIVMNKGIPIVEYISFRKPALSTIENDIINCDQAEEVGAKIHKMDSQVYSDISLKRSDQVKTLLNLKKGVKIGGDTVHVDPTIPFSRLLIQVERSEDMKAYFSYELTQIPTSLFKDREMRKTNKAYLTSILTKEVTSVEDTPGCAYVLEWWSFASSCALEGRFDIW